MSVWVQEEDDWVKGWGQTVNNYLIWSADDRDQCWLSLHFEDTPLLSSWEREARVGHDEVRQYLDKDWCPLSLCHCVRVKIWKTLSCPAMLKLFPNSTIHHKGSPTPSITLSAYPGKCLMSWLFQKNNLLQLEFLW